MSAVLNSTDTVRAAHAAALDRTRADTEVTRLKLRVAQIEDRARATRLARADHQRQVTEALLEDSPMPKALPPQPVEPDAALAIVKAELARAEAALADAAGQHRAAIVRHIEHRRDEAVADYQAAFQHFTERLRSVAAYDRILTRTQLPNALPPLFHSRLSVPALRGDPEASPGLAIDGRNFFAKPELDSFEQRTRLALGREVGPLPF